MANSLAQAQIRSLRGKSKKSPAPPKEKKSKSVQSAPMDAPDQDWRAADDMRVLSQAHQIRNDKGRMAGVQRHLAGIQEALSGPVKTSRKRS